LLITIVATKIEEFVMSSGLPLALLIGMISLSEGAFASDGASPVCVDLSKPKAEVAAHHGQWKELNTSQWEFLRGIFAMNPKTPPGLPYGDHAALAQFEGDSRGIVFFIDDDKACTPMLVPPELLSMMSEVATHTVKHQAPGL
jgi:hypothetical protein